MILAIGGRGPPCNRFNAFYRLQAIDNLFNKETIMGLMTRFFGKPTAPVPAAPITTGHPATNLATVRSAPVVAQPRYFQEPEANALAALAKEKTADARQSVRAYNHLSRIEDADTRVHRAHRRYQVAVADNAIARKKSDARLERKVHQLRPEYARLDAGVQRASTTADQRISELRSRMK